MASVATYPFQYAELNPTNGQKSHSLANSALILIFLYQSDISAIKFLLVVSKMFLACSCVKVSLISS